MNEGLDFNTNYFQVGGTLNANAPCYVERSADDQLYNNLLEGKFCYVFNSRQAGKSSLLAQTKYKLEAEDQAICVVIDLNQIGTLGVSSEQWYNSLMYILKDTLELNVDLETWRKERSKSSSMQYLKAFIEDIVLTQRQEKIFIFIDELDTILRLQFPSDDFFALLRTFYNEQTHQSKSNRLSFALFGVATPYDLIENHEGNTPFNIGTAINLKGFKLGEIDPLIDGLRKKADNPKNVIEEILNWTQGQPFLTQKICNLILKSQDKIAKDKEKEKIEILVKSSIIDDWESQDEPEHLRTIRDRILFKKNLDDSEWQNRLELYQKIMQSNQFGTEEIKPQLKRAAIDLQLAGLVVDKKRYIEIYNPIYKQIFNEDWLFQQVGSLYQKKFLFSLNEGRGKISRSNRKFLEFFQDRFNLTEQKIRELEQKARQEYIQKQKIITYYKDFYQDICKRTDQIDDKELKKLLERQKDLGLTDNEREIAEKEVNQRHIRSRIDWLNINKVKFGVAVGIVGVVVIIILIFLDMYPKSKKEVVDNIQVENCISKPCKIPDFEENPVLSNLLTQQNIAVNSLAFTADGTKIVIGGKNGKLIIFDLETRELLAESTVFKDSITSIAVSSINNEIVGGDRVGNIIMWNWKEDRAEQIGKQDYRINSVAISQDENYIVSGDESGRINIFNLKDRTKNTIVGGGHSVGVNAIVINSKKSEIISGSSDNTVKIQDLAGSSIKNFNAEQPIFALAIDSTRQKIFAGLQNGTIRIFERNNETKIFLKGSNEKISSLAISQNGNILVSGSNDRTVRVWDLSQQIEKQSLAGHQNYISSVAIDPDGKTIISGSTDKTIKVWQAKQ